ncbi:retron St85 family RNA-directed DNA polymerase [Clostridium algidicarnis]|uniref:retron St85 family RNA-directed DNA polymerase n=1 Tax=Clostridium algidicarnis TaxID=37659 RepID=UPI001C0AD1A8|nr:retron St85 family RNA-directed DNA polymerase [Clostridium algidicarnis]MBU3209055.1 retron St85 family RNA-directed DNA polymerase [Clostridium algidicarnis]MBU3228776.1 retron St85 family RNA-directed DNA polymerase [Clostridium algidicarnis]MBU3252320.1 retron St85 family RNA-directed DNA polymerase [Clostridium algidicarnis]
MENYLESLKIEITEQGYDEYYTTKCIEYAERLLSNGLPVIFDTDHLSLVTGAPKQLILKMIFANSCFYSEARLPKKSGGIRVLNIPSIELKYVQRWILDNILKKINVSSYATGFCDNKSIVDNAKVHIGRECILNMDIKDFFPTITFKMIFRIFVYYGYTKEVSFTLARLCTFENFLPQGSPASPYLSNIVSLKIDKRLSLLAKKYKANYSRYADDITFSGNHGIKKMSSIVSEILEDEGFKVNDGKTRLQYSYQRQEVTGLVINNGKVRVNKHYKRELYQILYYCIKFGVNSHLQKINSTKTFYKEHLYGKAYFVNMVEPDEGRKLFDLLECIQWDY